MSNNIIYRPAGLAKLVNNPFSKSKSDDESVKYKSPELCNAIELNIFALRLFSSPNSVSGDTNRSDCRVLTLTLNIP